MIIIEGWIKLHRQFTDWEWYSDTNTKVVFLHLLLIANVKPSRYKGFMLSNGQLITTLPEISESVGLSIRNVRTALKHLKDTGELTTKATNKFMLITIVNWELYQKNNEEVTGKRQTNDTQVTLKRQTNDTQVTRVVEEEKEEKEEKEREEEKDIICSAEPNVASQIIAYLNKSAKTNYKANSKTTQAKIKARLNEGFILDDFIAVIDKKCAEWLNDVKMAKFLRPETLFGTKFEGYLNQPLAMATTSDGHKETKSERNTRLLNEYFSRGDNFDRNRIETDVEHDLVELQ